MGKRSLLVVEDNQESLELLIRDLKREFTEEFIVLRAATCRQALDILDKEIEYILDYGIEVSTNTRLGRDFTLDDLKARGFEAIFLALGAQNGTKNQGLQ